MENILTDISASQVHTFLTYMLAQLTEMSEEQ